MTMIERKKCPECGEPMRVVSFGVDECSNETIAITMTFRCKKHVGNINKEMFASMDELSSIVNDLASSMIHGVLS